MRLGIISDCIHYKTPDGRIGTEVHILLRQIEALAAYFTETTICCPVAPSSSGKVLSFYANETIRFVPVPVVGGNTFADKIKIAQTLAKWWSAFKEVNNSSDIIYQRFPNNLNIPGFFYFHFLDKPKFGTYTGTWQNYDGEPATYRFQKWLLKKFFKGPVWIYSDQELIGNKLFAGFSPSYSKAEWDEEEQQVANRIERINTNGLSTFRLITVGTLIDYKNQITILKACEILKRRNFSFHLTVVGDGPMRSELYDFVSDHNLSSEITFAGKMNFQELRQLYRQNDFVVQAPLAEGFGKVPIEGFFHGVIPIINKIGLAKQMTGDGERGFLFDGKDSNNLAQIIMGVVDKKAVLPAMIRSGRHFAQSQTLDAWADNYYKTVLKYFEKH